MKELVDKFLSWQLPDTICSDACVTEANYPNRSGTNLLTAAEAEQMLEYVVGSILEENKRLKEELKKPAAIDKIHAWQILDNLTKERDLARSNAEKYLNSCDQLQKVAEKAQEENKRLGEANNELHTLIRQQEEVVNKSVKSLERIVKQDEIIETLAGLKFERDALLNQAKEDIDQFLAEHDENVRLHTENERLREALEDIVAIECKLIEGLTDFARGMEYQRAWWRCSNVAKEALGESNK